DRNRSHWSTSKTPSYTKSVSWQHHPNCKEVNHDKSFINDSLQTFPGLILFFLPWIRLPFPDFYIYIL
ncbi:hypothetical protein, partial [Escherichia coli]|uniref:hypothetical protein n=1 Tax=Escherichia coli TaxID=562 RepID=UPI00098C7875